MGYKLAGYNHLGGVEIDAKMAGIYRLNHKPHLLYNEDIRIFNNRVDLPEVLYNLDILDGSPPCTTFSMAGDRENTWGKKKIFAEGQAEQRLDDLTFVYCDTILKLKPKVAILENVKGLAAGNAIWYSKKIIKTLEHGGYNVQLFCLNAATMGVPQSRERVFFIARRRELNLPQLKLNFNQQPITFSKVIEHENKTNNLSERLYYYWKRRTPKDLSFGDIIQRLENRLSMFSNPLIHSGRVAPTITSSGVSTLYDIPRHISTKELIKVGSFPSDYNFNKASESYVVGMSVPPVMMANIAHQIYLQWFK